ncbi:hypothetical protein P167DRAFT_576004 [Morchella conica CCBAS932]|uniref:Uncharacterized protein n=1 Tax=Morchella conica CCBAS932 TaxID=1392247 RepID=A0A3N4KJE3_9PEZI|nr:hypothetical protein P167DRAFT_576004 [Morchella conica CCBAS932]
MARDRLRGDSHRSQTPVAGPSVRARYQRLRPDTTSTPKVRKGNHTNATTPTPQEDHTHPIAITPTSMSKAPSLPTSITLLIDNKPFSIPHNPIEAFHATRTQTIASFRAMLAGTATDSDMNFVFGAVLAPSSTTYTSAPSLYATSSDSATAKSTSSIGQLVSPRYTGSTRDIKIDSHTFTLPTDAVDAFLATRELTIAAFRKVSAGEAVAGGGGDVAFVFGTAFIATPDGSSIVGDESVRAPQACIAGGEITTAPASEHTGEVRALDKVGDQEDYDKAEDNATTASNGGRSPHSWRELSPAVPMLGERLRRRALRDTAQDETGFVASTATAIPTPVLPALTPSTAAPPLLANQLPKTFLGNFRNITHACRALNESDTWWEAIYVEA